MDLAGIATTLRERLAGRVAEDHPLASLTTYRLGGPAELFVEPAGMEDLEVMGRALSEAGGSATNVPILCLGRGSNLVVSDHGVPGIVVRIGAAFSWIEPWAAGGPGVLSVGAATPLPQVANFAARRGLEGAEWLIAIPGSAGGAVRMNAGAHGGQLSDVLGAARVFDLHSRRLEERTPASLGLSYRRSNLADHEVVVEASLGLVPGDPEIVKARMERYRRHRAETQPGALQNAGSVFKNPDGDSAGRLVEAAGLKGFRVGGARVSELHANFFIAGEGATAQDVYDLVHAVRARVADQLGVTLEPEIRFVGDFREWAGTEVPA
jgi:UDP-N-acetylmuramate dehydrogenase